MDGESALSGCAESGGNAAAKIRNTRAAGHRGQPPLAVAIAEDLCRPQRDNCVGRTNAHDHSSVTPAHQTRFSVASESEVNTKSNLQTRKHTTTAQQKHTLTQSNYNHLIGKNAPAYSLIAAQTAFSPSLTSQNTCSLQCAATAKRVCSNENKHGEEVRLDTFSNMKRRLHSSSDDARNATDAQDSSFCTQY
jgi:hypothetical protein